MRRLLAISAFVVLLVPSTALAVHWPYFGGDSGRSGLQPVDGGTVPLTPPLYRKSADADRFVKTSIVTTAGPPTAQRLAYGTNAGIVHVRDLTTGNAVGPEEGVSIDEGGRDEDVLGARQTSASVSFADASTAAGPSQLFVVHNDDDSTAVTPPAAPTAGADLEIAQVNATTGLVTQQKKVENTDGFTISSSPVLTAPDANGNRLLFFTANRADGSGQLFRVPITNPGDAGATIGAATTSATFSPTVAASPTLTSLRDTAGNAASYVTVGASNRLLSFSTVDLSAGPGSEGFAGPVATPSVPVQASGNPPAAGQPVTTAPALYATITTNGGTNTVVARFEQNGNSQTLTTARQSPAVNGQAAPGLAVAQTSTPSGLSPSGRIVVTTANNLYLFAADTLFPLAAFGGPVDQISGTQGFSVATPLVSGQNIYVTRDDGRRLVLRLSDAGPVALSEFPDQDQNGSNLIRSGVGQPAVSRGYVQFGGPDGIFVYRNTDADPPTVALTAPADNARVTGNVTLSAIASDPRGIASVDFRIDGRSVGTDNSPEGSPFGAPGATYSVTVPASRIGGSRTSLTAVATDGGGRTATSAPRSITGTGASAAQAAARNRIVFGVRRYRISTAFSRGLRAEVRCTSRCTVRATLKYRLKTIGTARLTMTRAGTRAFRVKITSSGRRVIGRSRSRSVRLTVRLDPSGAARAFDRTGGYVLRP